MQSNKLVYLSGLALIGFLVLLYFVFRPAVAVRNNILLITLDGLRADHLSCYGYDRKTSPNIDALAEHGLIFKQIITSGCATKTALTSLFTSLDYRSHKMSDNETVLNDKFLTLAEALQAQGYATFGVVATPWLQRDFNFQQGFDRYEDFREVAMKRRIVSSGMAANKVLNWLAKHGRQQPFFVYCHFEEPHPPWLEKSPWLTEEESSTKFFDAGCTYIPGKKESDQVSDQKKRNLIAKYDGAILYADSHIGRIVAKLREMGLDKKTIIAISTDHGYELMDHGKASHAFCPYDEVVRIPLIIRRGAGANAAQTFVRRGRIFDIGPTLLHLAGVPQPRQWEGTSLLQHNRITPKYDFTFGFAVQAVRTARYKLVYQRIQSRKANYWKSPGFEFYDLLADPGETRDISALNLPEFMIMKKELAQYKKELYQKEFIPGTMSPRKARLDKKTLNKLKTLGYIQ